MSKCLKEIKKDFLAISFISMGKLKYLSAMQFIDGVIGNSSSGIIEAPSLMTGTINIGNRQKGRTKATTIIDCSPSCEDILRALDELYSESFQDCLSAVVNPYGTGGAASQIVDKLRKIDIDSINVQKPFFNLDEHLLQKAIEGCENKYGTL